MRTYNGSFNFGRFTFSIGTTSSRAAPPVTFSAASMGADRRVMSSMSRQFIRQFINYSSKEVEESRCVSEVNS